jgi:hypothetical protein
VLRGVRVEAVEERIDQQERRDEGERPRPPDAECADDGERDDDGERVRIEDRRMRPRRNDVREVEGIARPGPAVVEELRVRERPVGGDEGRERECAREIGQRVAPMAAEEDDDERGRREKPVRDLHEGRSAQRATGER